MIKSDIANLIINIISDNFETPKLITIHFCELFSYKSYVKLDIIIISIHKLIVEVTSMWKIYFLFFFWKVVLFSIFIRRNKWNNDVQILSLPYIWTKLIEPLLWWIRFYLFCVVFSFLSISKYRSVIDR